MAAGTPKVTSLGVEFPTGPSEWGGRRCWRDAGPIAVKVGEYGRATVTVGGNGIVSDGLARLDIPNGGLNRFTAAELREYAAALIAVADRMDARDEWLGGE